MKEERKICLPVYKIFYALLFAVLLSIVRGVTEVKEIGITLDPYMGLLSLVFCADTYETEHRGRRWEIFKLLPERSRTRAIYKRLLIQLGYLFLTALAGYGCFYWQRPFNQTGMSSWKLFLLYLPAVAVSLCFWGVVSMTLVNCLKNLWAGIGCAFPLWLFCNSAQGDQLLGKYNVFAYGSRLLEDCGADWVWGKAIALVLAGMLLLAVPSMLKRKGW